jgi:hypothetical protein
MTTSPWPLLTMFGSRGSVMTTSPSPSSMAFGSRGSATTTSPSPSSMVFGSMGSVMTTSSSLTMFYWTGSTATTPPSSLSTVFDSRGSAMTTFVAEPPELFRFKCASHRYTADTNSTHFKRNNPLVCRVSARYNHGSTGSKQVHLVRRRVYNYTSAHQLLIYRILNIIINCFEFKVNLYKYCLKRQAKHACQIHSGRRINTRQCTLRRLTPRSARSMVSFRRVTASQGRIPLHGPAKGNRSWPCGTIHGVSKGHI